VSLNCLAPKRAGSTIPVWTRSTLAAFNDAERQLTWLTSNRCRPNFSPNRHDYQIWMRNVACERSLAKGLSQIASVAVEQAHAAGDHLNRPRPGERVPLNDQLPSGSIA
jgi:hypothetical protein